MEKVRTNQGGIAICVRLRTGGEGVLDFPHFSAYVLCEWPLVRADLIFRQTTFRVVKPTDRRFGQRSYLDCLLHTLFWLRE